MATKKIPEREVVTARRGPDGEWTGHPDAVREAMAAIATAKERASRWPQTPEGHILPLAAMTTLASLFPTLRDADGVDPWDVDRFLDWLCGPVPSSGAQYAGRFVLAVWNPSADWRDVAREAGIEGMDERLRRFDAMDAAGVWDDAHRLAFMIWLESPFWA